MKKTQPRIDWLECDRCGITLDSRNSPKNGSIATNCNGLDHLGMAVGKGESHDFDFCDNCSEDYLRIVCSVESYIRDSAHYLINGGVAQVARGLVSRLIYDEKLPAVLVKRDKEQP